jgi:hypothetical protein
MEENYLNFCAQELQQATCEAIVKEDWIKPILGNMTKAASKGVMNGIIFVKDHEALKDADNITKLCFFFRQKGFFVMVNHNDENGQFINVSWDWNADKQRAIDLAEAIGDQLLLAVEGMTGDIENINEILGNYAIAQLKGESRTYRKAIELIESRMAEPTTEE